MSLESSIDSLAAAIHLLAVTLASGKIHPDGVVSVDTTARARHTAALTAAATMAGTLADDTSRAAPPRKTALNLPPKEAPGEPVEDPLEDTQDMPPVRQPTQDPPTGKRRGRPPGSGKQRIQPEEIDRIDSPAVKEAHAANIAPKVAPPEDDRTVEEGEEVEGGTIETQDPEKFEHLSKLVVEAAEVNYQATIKALNNHGVKRVSEASVEQYESLAAALKKAARTPTKAA